MKTYKFINPFGPLVYAAEIWRNVFFPLYVSLKYDQYKLLEGPWGAETIDRLMD